MQKIFSDSWAYKTAFMPSEALQLRPATPKLPKDLSSPVFARQRLELHCFLWRASPGVFCFLASLPRCQLPRPRGTESFRLLSVVGRTLPAFRTMLPYCCPMLLASGNDTKSGAVRPQETTRKVDQSGLRKRHGKWTSARPETSGTNKLSTCLPLAQVPVLHGTPCAPRKKRKTLCEGTPPPLPALSPISIVSSAK